MNLSYFISKRIRSGTEGFSSTIHSIAIILIGVVLAAGIIAFLILKGFQDQVIHKMSSFSADLIITKYTTNNASEEQPFDFNIDLYNHPERFSEIDHIQEFSHKAGLIKTDNEVLGVVIKGVGRSFDLKHFAENMTEGRFLKFSDSSYSHETVLSEVIADKLDVKVGDDVIIHFFQKPPRFRKLKIVGLYRTDLSEYFDGKFILGDIRMIQQLNNWSDSTAGGLQIYLKDTEKMDLAEEQVRDETPFTLAVEKISDKYYTIFDWLGLLNRQVQILLGIILFVICVTMISVVMILVMERTRMIGVLKALGASNRMIRSVFFYHGVSLIVKGLLLGNALGIGLCFLQYHFKIMKLDPHDYYMTAVPVAWNWMTVVLLNLLFFVLIGSIIFLLTFIISSVRPIKAIRFD